MSDEQLAASGVSDVAVSPARPAGVPAGASWVADAQLWELAERNAAGEREGVCCSWRADGSLYWRGSYRAGECHGPFVILHPNGQVAREGVYVDGRLDGDLTAFKSDAPTTESLRSCCVPDNAWRLHTRYQRGESRGDTFYDRAGKPLLSDGTLRPERPAAVPTSAQFDEFSGRWADGAFDDHGSWTGCWRFWTTSGQLDEEAEYRTLWKGASKRFDEHGAVWLEVAFEGDGVRHGAYRRRFVAPGESPYADPRIVEERGGFSHGDPTGHWMLLDAVGRVVREIAFGPAPSLEEAVTLPVLSDGISSQRWWELARALRAEGGGREALCAAARALAHGLDLQSWNTFWQEITPRLTTEADTRLVDELADDKATVLTALTALVSGADPAAVLRTLSSLLKGAVNASVDFIEAAIRLAPERPMAYMTRALARIESGDPEGARADAERGAADSRNASEFLQTYLRILFPEYSFWPSRERPESAFEEAPDEPGQPLERVRHTLQVYATRLHLVRAALASLAAKPSSSWLPPELPTLLPDGPIALRSYDAQIVDETDEGSETTAVQVDESLDLSGCNIPALLRLARGQWAAICWLCWSAGLNEVALPTALAPPADFRQAVGMAITRYWRAQDATITGGLRSITAGVASFVWEGIDMDTLPRLFADIVFEEMRELRALFLYLASPENLSPFQSDLRQA